MSENNYKDELNQDFNKRIKGLINGEKPHSWGKKHGLERSIIQTLMKGKILDPPNLVKLSQKLEISIDWLLTGEEAKAPLPPRYTLKEEDLVNKLIKLLRSGSEKEISLLRILLNTDSPPKKP